MTRSGLLALAASTFIAAAVHAQKHLNPPSDPPIRITINPEARVSVAMRAEVVSGQPCGTPLHVPIQIVNEGAVTPPLEGNLVYGAPGVALEFKPDVLTGAREEHRTLTLTLAKPGLTDVTIAFKAKNEVADIGGRDRVHFLVHCNPV